jgi:hypothetical protein
MGMRRGRGPKKTPGYTATYCSTLTHVGRDYIMNYAALGLLEAVGYNRDNSPLYLPNDVLAIHAEQKALGRVGRLQSGRDGCAVFSRRLCPECGQWFRPGDINRRGHCAACAARLAGPARAGRLGDADA